MRTITQSLPTEDIPPQTLPPPPPFPPPPFPHPPFPDHEGSTFTLQQFVHTLQSPDVSSLPQLPVLPFPLLPVLPDSILPVLPVPKLQSINPDIPSNTFSIKDSSRKGSNHIRVPDHHLYVGTRLSRAKIDKPSSQRRLIVDGIERVLIF